MRVVSKGPSKKEGKVKRDEIFRVMGCSGTIDFQVFSLIRMLYRLRDMLVPVDIFERPLTVQKDFSIMYVFKHRFGKFFC